MDLPFIGEDLERMLDLALKQQRSPRDDPERLARLGNPGATEEQIRAVAPHIRQRIADRARLQANDSREHSPPQEPEQQPGPPGFGCPAIESRSGRRVIRKGDTFS